MQIIEVLQNIGYTNLVDFGREVRTRPLYRDSDNKTVLSINKQTGNWYDFADKSGGCLAQLVQKTLKLPSLSDTKTYLGDLPSFVYTGESFELTEIKKFDKILLTKLTKDNSYWNNRGISDFTLNQFNGGVANNGRMKGRFVTPIFDDKQDLIGFAGRAISPYNEIKWKLIGQKKQWVFPLQFTQDIKQNNSVFLVESLGDFFALFECGIINVLVTFGVSLSPKIIQHLLKLDVGKIIISFNNDSDNNFVGNDAAKGARLQLLNFFDENQVRIKLPPKKDFGIMSREEIRKWKAEHLDSITT